MAMLWSFPSLTITLSSRSLIAPKLTWCTILFDFLPWLQFLTNHWKSLVVFNNYEVVWDAIALFLCFTSFKMCETAPIHIVSHPLTEPGRTSPNQRFSLKTGQVEMMPTSSAPTGPVGQSFPPDFFDMTVLFHLWRFGHLCKKVQAAASLNGSVQGYCPVLSWCPLDSARNRYSDFGSGKADGFGHNLELSLSQVHKNFLDIQIPVLLMEFCLLSLIKLSSLRIKDKYIALAISCSPFMGLFDPP